MSDYLRIALAAAIIGLGLLIAFPRATAAVPQPVTRYCDSGYGFYAPCAIVDEAWNRKWSI